MALEDHYPACFNCSPVLQKVFRFFRSLVITHRLIEIRCVKAGELKVALTDQDWEPLVRSRIVPAVLVPQFENQKVTF